MVLPLHSQGFVFIGLSIGNLFVDGRAILNELGTDRPPRNVAGKFLITTSPSVFGGEIRGFGNGPFQGFMCVIRDLSLVMALIILLAIGQRNSELVGDGKLT